MFSVKELQAHLRNMVDEDVKIDGIAGPRTREAAEKLLEKYEPRALARVKQDPQALFIAVQQIVMREVAGLRVGLVDGKIGPVFEKAENHWRNGPWRGVLMKEARGDEEIPANMCQIWPKQDDVQKFFGKAGENLARFYSPYPLRLYTPSGQVISSFSANKKVIPSLGRVLRRVLEEYGLDEIQRLRLDVWGGCFNMRPMRGGRRLSMHSYGIAIDWDPTRNALKSDHTRAAFAKPEYEAWWRAWEAEGWLSLGRARDFDWMHVQAARL